MGEEMTVTGAFFVNTDSGEVFKWGEVVDISTSDLTTEAQVEEKPPIVIDNNREYNFTGTFFMTKAMYKRILLLGMGWTAKGPLRKKGIKKALKLQKPFDWSRYNRFLMDFWHWNAWR